jgi:uncharacterized protein (TIGR02001 family)
VLRVPDLAFCSALCAIFGTPIAAAESPSRWSGPFGGEFHASFTLATDYAQSGISSTDNQPALQAGLDWHSADLLGKDAPQLRFYTAVLGTDVSFPNSGPGEEIDLAAGFKLGLLDKRLTLDVGYIRYLYPSFPAALASSMARSRSRSTTTSARSSPPRACAGAPTPSCMPARAGTSAAWSPCHSPSCRCPTAGG